MAEHSWIIENLETYLAGGLTPDEGARLETHVADCETCARALNETRELDRSLDWLFTAVRPAPEMEDRVIQGLRQARPPRPSWLVPVGAGLAAIIMVGALGAFMLHFVSRGSLPFFRPSPEVRFRLSAADPFAFVQDSMGKPTPLGVVALGDKEVGVGEVSGSVAADVNAIAESLHRDNKWFFAPAEGHVERFEVNGVKAGEALSVTQSQSNQPQFVPPKTRLSSDAGFNEFERVGERGAVSKATDPIAAGVAGAAGQAPKRDVDVYYSFEDVALGKGEKAAGKEALSTAGRQAGGAGMGYPELRLAEKPSKSEASIFRPNSLFGSASVIDGTNQQGKADKKPADAKETERLRVLSLADDAQRAGGKDGEQAGRQFGRRFGTDPALGQQAGEAAQRAQAGTTAAKVTEPAAPPSSRRIIRTGDVEFEIDSFDDATATVTRLVGAIPGGFIATINSEKLPNGKVRGSVVVRVPPERLDGLLLELRKELSKHGELKGQKIGSQDITKQYTDMESRLKAARAMEERLLQIIKTGKGEIKDLVIAEKELGIWRTKIEELEGELRYYGNLVALSTLTISLTEKEIRAAVGLVEIERVQMGIEVEDVEKAQREALAAVAEAKGTITKAELKQHSAGQFSALLHFSATPERAGPLRDRLRQLGTVARFDVDRTQQTEGGTGKPADGKVTRRDVQFIVSLYNLANIAPRETIHLQVAAVDAEAAYKTVLEQVRKALGRVVTSDLNRQRNDQTKGTIHFEVKTAEADGVLAALKDVGELMSLQVTEDPDTQNVTRAKRGFQVQIWSLASVAPRETAALQLATRDVPASYRALQQAIAQAKGRVLNAQLNEQDRHNISAQLDFEVRRTEEAAIDTALAAQGDIFSRTVSRAAENETTVDGKVRFQTKLVNAASLSPRETITLAVEVRDVDQSVAAFGSYVAESQGRVVQSQVARVRDGQVTAKLIYDVPLSAAHGLAEKLKAAGIVRAVQMQRNTQVPDSKLAVARLDVTLSNAELIVPSEEGFWPQIRTGLKASFLAIAWSLTVVIIGVCVLLPWAVVIYAGYVIVLRLRRRAASSA